MNKKMVKRALVDAYEKEYVEEATRSLTLLFSDEIKDDTIDVEDSWIYKIANHDDVDSKQYLQRMRMIGEAIVYYVDLRIEKDRQRKQNDK